MILTANSSNSGTCNDLMIIRDVIHDLFTSTFPWVAMASADVTNTKRHLAYLMTVPLPYQYASYTSFRANGLLHIICACFVNINQI